MSVSSEIPTSAEMSISADSASQSGYISPGSLAAGGRRVWRELCPPAAPRQLRHISANPYGDVRERRGASAVPRNRRPDGRRAWERRHVLSRRESRSCPHRVPSLLPSENIVVLMLIYIKSKPLILNLLKHILPIVRPSLKISVTT